MDGDSDSYPELADGLRPSPREIKQYSRLIMEHEQRPPSARPECEREAELHLWAVRAVETQAQRPSSGRKKRKRGPF